MNCSLCNNELTKDELKKNPRHDAYQAEIGVEVYGAELEEFWICDNCEDEWNEMQEVSRKEI